MGDANFIKTIVRLKRDAAGNNFVKEEESCPSTTLVTKLVIQLRRDTTKNWIANKDIVPAEGEPCFDIDEKTLKIGDGITTYENLPKIGNADIEDLQASIDDMQFDVESMKTTLFPEGEKSLEERMAVIETKISESTSIEIVEF